jgi:hypothetical protein
MHGCVEQLARVRGSILRPEQPEQPIPWQQASGGEGQGGQQCKPVTLGHRTGKRTVRPFDSRAAEESKQESGGIYRGFILH